MKAMILAAGRGERMRPLSDATAKPLLEVGDKRLIEHNLFQLVNIGVREVVINLHYRAEQIMSALGNGEKYGLSILYSYEDQQCLGTGGGVFRALNLLGNEPFILLSGDIWSDYHFPLSFIQAQTDAHLVFVDNPDFHPQGDYGLSSDGKVNFSPSRFTYAGIAKIHPHLFANCQPGEFALAPLLDAAIKQNLVSGEYYDGPWFNVGTPQQLKSLNDFLLTIKS